MRYLITLIALGFFSCQGFSQMDFGLKLGANLSSASNFEVPLDGGEPHVQNNANRLGYQYGIWWSAPLGANNWRLRSELLYIQKSWDLGGTQEVDQYFQFHYLTLPVIAQYQFKNLTIGAGPELSYLIDQSIKLDGANLGDSPFIDEGKLELGANLDAQYTLNRWQFSLRYSLDLTPFYELMTTDVNGEPNGNSRLKHRALQFSVGYSLTNN